MLKTIFEWIKNWIDVKVGTVEDYTEAFTIAIGKADRDNDGFISRGEFIAVLGEALIEVRKRKK